MSLSQAEIELEKFLTGISRTDRLWDAAVVSTVALKLQDEWISIAASCRLHLSGTQRFVPTRHLPITERILAAQDSIPISELGSWLRKSLSGSNVVNGMPIRFASSAKPSNADDQRLEFMPFTYGGGTQLSTQLSTTSFPPPFVNAHRWQATGDAARNFLNRLAGGAQSIDEELRSLQYPWDGIGHLMRGSGAFIYGWSTDTQALIDAVAPLGIALNARRCELRGAHLRLSVAALSRSAVRLSSVGFAGDDHTGKGVSGIIRTPARGWSKANTTWFLEKDHEVGDLRSVALFLRVKGTPIQRLDLQAIPQHAKPIRAAHALHHRASETSWLKHLLEASGSAQREFERAVSRLFGLLGFGVDYLGDEKDQNCVDAIVELGRDHLLIVECTTGTLKGDGKLAKLVRRSAELRRGLREKGIDVSPTYRAPSDPAAASLLGRKMYTPLCVVPVMLCSLPFESLAKGEISDAQTDGVAVLSREDLQTLLSAADTDADCEQTLGQLITGRLQFPLASRHGP